MNRTRVPLGVLALVAGLSLGFVLLSPPHKWQSNQLPRNWRIGMATLGTGDTDNFATPRVPRYTRGDKQTIGQPERLTLLGGLAQRLLYRVRTGAGLMNR